MWNYDKLIEKLEKDVIAKNIMLTNYLKERKERYTSKICDNKVCKEFLFYILEENQKLRNVIRDLRYKIFRTGDIK